MAQIVNNDKTTFVITQRGLEEITYVMSTPTAAINITSVKIGDANGEYYAPQEGATSLKHQISGGVFPVVSKTLLEDGLTVCFRFYIPETFGDCDIREIGLYAEKDGTEYLFALGTQQPFVKPSTEDYAYISVDYYIFLKSANLSEVYPKIYLNPDEQIATEQDLQDIMSTVLFSQANLMDQIGHNSQTIGLNRAAQLNELIDKTRAIDANSVAYSTYSQFESAIGRENIFGYWVFNYPSENKSESSVADLGPRGINLSTSSYISAISQEYLGLASSLIFSSPEYYALSAAGTPNFVNAAGTSDIDFTVIYCSKAIGSHNRTILSKYNSSSNSKIFEIRELSNRSINIRLFQTNSNYLSYTSGANVIPEGAHSVIIDYKASNHSITVYVNGSAIVIDPQQSTGQTYTHMLDDSSSTTIATSYSIDGSGNPVDYVDSSMAILSILYTRIPSNIIRSVAILLATSIGENSCAILA